MKRFAVAALAALTLALGATAAETGAKPARRTATRSAAAAAPALNPATRVVHYNTLSRSARELPVDDRTVYDYTTDTYLPYGYYDRNAYLVVPESIEGVDPAHVEAFSSLLADKLFGPGSGDISERARQFANSATLTDIEGKSVDVVVMPERPENLGLGVQGFYKMAYPTAANSKFVEWTLIDGIDSGSGMGAGVAAGTEYVVLMAKPTEWCPSGILTAAEIFAGGKPSKRIVSLLNAQLNIQARNQDNCVTPNSATRVPETFSIGRKGISFVFAKYEVACGAAGNHEVLLTWAKLAPYLRPEFLRWVKSATGWKTFAAPDNMWE